MNQNIRVNELRQLLQFDYEQNYYPEELIEVLEDFSKACVDAFFAERHADNMQYTFRDLRHYLYDKGIEFLGEGCEEINKFKSISKDFETYLFGLQRGRAGELHAKWALESLRIDNIIIPNVELRKENNKVEIDYVVITPKHIYQIEVKNPAFDVVVDADGNYYKAGQKLRPEYNVGIKNNYKDMLLREAIGNVGIPDGAKKVKVEDIFMIANNQSNLDCRYKYIKKCNEATLPHIIDECSDPDIYTIEQMEEIAETIRKRMVHEKYPINFDMKELIESLVTITSMIENASQEKMVYVSDINADKEPENLTNITVDMWSKVSPIIKGVVALASIEAGLYAISILKKTK